MAHYGRRSHHVIDIATLPLTIFRQTGRREAAAGSGERHELRALRRLKREQDRSVDARQAPDTSAE
jgi:hypothetical protein